MVLQRILAVQAALWTPFGASGHAKVARPWLFGGGVGPSLPPHFLAARHGVFTAMSYRRASYQGTSADVQSLKLLSFRPRQDGSRSEWRKLLSMLCVPPFENREGWGSLNCEGARAVQPAIGLTNSPSGHAANGLLLLPTQQVPEQ